MSKKLNAKVKKNENKYKRMFLDKLEDINFRLRQYEKLFQADNIDAYEKDVIFGIQEELSKLQKEVNMYVLRKIKEEDNA